jgi:Sulfotransferase family
VPRIAWELYPDAREVILVRDWRDVICSFFAFNSKRNTVGFGRNRFVSDEEYVFYVGRRARQLLEDWKTRSSVAQLVRYEDLVKRPTETVAGLLEYLGLDRRLETVERLVQRAFESPGFDGHRTSVEDRLVDGGRSSHIRSPESVTGAGQVLAELG